MKKRVGKERSICTMEELKKGVREELFCFSDMFKADPLGFSFSMLSFSLPSFSSLVRSFSHHLSEVSIAAGHNVVDFEFLSPFGNCMFVCVTGYVCVWLCVELDYRGGAA